MLLPAGWTLNVANTWYTNGIGAPFSQELTRTSPI